MPLFDSLTPSPHRSLRERIMTLLEVMGALAIALLLIAATRHIGVAQEDDDELRAVASVREVMDVMVIPTSAALWNVAREAPADEEGWKELESMAILLAEAGNLMLMEGRRVDDDVWVETSQTMVDAGEDALVAARERDADGVIDAGNAVIDACEICHEKHLTR